MSSTTRRVSGPSEAAPDDLGLRQAMRTTPAVREYTDDDVPDQILFEILDDARYAPNGANRQAWHVTVVRDVSARQRIAELYKLGFAEYLGFHAAGLVPFVASEALWRNPPGTTSNPAIDLDAARSIPLPDGTQDHIAKAPVLLVITVDLTNISAVDSGLGRLSISAGASVYPFAHNILFGGAGTRLRRPLHLGARPTRARAQRVAAHPARARTRHHAADRQTGQGDHQAQSPARRVLRHDRDIRRPTSEPGRTNARLT